MIEGSSAVNRDALPEQYPTHANSPDFWEQLGRTVATFGFLEMVLGKAIFALTATRIYRDCEIEEAYLEWQVILEEALCKTLRPLADSYGRAAKSQRISTDSVEALVKTIKEAADVRDILCHASWGPPDEERKSMPFFVNRKIELVESRIDTPYLLQVQKHVLDLICDVVDSVTQIGLQFPGSNGPGGQVWSPGR